MTMELYFKSISKLSKALGLDRPIELDSSLSATLISDHRSPLVLNIGFDFETNSIILKTPITTHFPKSRVAVQHVLNQLVGDLLTLKKEMGRLVAKPEDNSIEYIKTIDLNQADEETLSTFVPIFLNLAKSWRRKFDQFTKKSQSNSFKREKEIVSFQNPF